MAAPPPSLVQTSSAAVVAGGSSQLSTSTSGPSSIAPLSGAASGPLANPLSVRVTSLRKPELYSSTRTTVDLSEDGDLLHSLLSGAPPAMKNLVHPASSVCPVLTFSNGRGAYLAGEYFRALLSFRNQSPRPLVKLFVRIELVSPQAQRSVLWDKEIPQMDGRANREVRVEQRILEPGKYTLSAHVAYSDTMTNEAKRLTWSSNFEVARGIAEVQKKLTLLPAHPQRITQLQTAAPRLQCVDSSNASDEDAFHLEATASSVLALHQQGILPRLLLSVSLQNTLPNMNLMITNVRLVLKEGSGFQLIPAPTTGGGTASSSAAALNQLYPQVVRGGGALPTQFAHQYSGGGRDALEDGHFCPGDQRQYTFELVHSLKATTGASTGAAATATATTSLLGGGLGNGPPSLAGGSASFFNSSGSGATLSKSLELGHLEWEWRRTSGDGGVDAGSIIRLHQQPSVTPPQQRPTVSASSLLQVASSMSSPLTSPVAPAVAAGQRLPDVELICLSCLPEEDASTKHNSNSAASSADMSTSSALTNSPPIVAGSPCVVTLVAVNRSSARRDVTLHVHPKKAFPHLMYTGPTVRPLGFIEPNSDVVFTVVVVPTAGGFWSLAGFLDLRDARNSNSMLWPAKALGSGAAPPPLQAATSSGGSSGAQGGLATPPLNVPSEPWPPKLCEILVL